MTLASYNVPLNNEFKKKKKKVVQAAFSQRGTSLRESFLLVWLWMVDALL